MEDIGDAEAELAHAGHAGEHFRQLAPRIVRYTEIIRRNTADGGEGRFASGPDNWRSSSLWEIRIEVALRPSTIKVDSRQTDHFGFVTVEFHDKQCRRITITGADKIFAALTPDYPSSAYRRG